MIKGKSVLYLFLFILIATAQQTSNQSIPTTAESGTTKRQYEYWIFQKECVEMYNHFGISILPFQCYLYSIAQIFNIILIPICLVLRVPQILKICHNKSVYGLSFFGNNLELLMTSMTLAYGLYANFSFWIYGQNIILSIQNIIIVSLFFQYPLGDTAKQRTAYLKSLLLPVFITFLVSSVFILQIVPDWCQEASIWLQLFVFLGARGSQIIKNFQLKTAQNVSLKTYAITLFANFARTITILVQSPNSLGYLLNYFVPIFINGTLVAQILIYNKKRNTKKQ